jgi:hypothetical protein
MAMVQGCCPTVTHVKMLRDPVPDRTFARSVGPLPVHILLVGGKARIGGYVLGDLVGARISQRLSKEGRKPTHLGIASHIS